MKPPIDNGVVLITGASSGIGREFARQLGPRAKGLALVARRTERLEDLKRELVVQRPDLKVGVYSCDLNDRVATDAMLLAVRRDMGPVDVLINNAGFGDFGPYDRVSWEKTERMINVNVTTLAYLTHRLVPDMVARGAGGVLNLSSGFGLSFLPGFAGYVGTKHFVTGFTECLRLELAPAGVAVTQACPGPVATEFVEHARMGGMPPPSFVVISAAQCARQVLAGFARGKAMVVPGLLMRLVIASGGFTPRFLLRWIGALLVGRVRAS